MKVYKIDVILRLRKEGLPRKVDNQLNILVPVGKDIRIVIAVK